MLNYQRQILRMEEILHQIVDGQNPLIIYNPIIYSVSNRYQ